MRKRWTYKAVDAAVVSHLQKALGVSAVLARILYHRGIADAASAEVFFHPRLDRLHDPFLLKDMDVAVARVERALRQGERLLLYGDYDVDGVTSVSLLCMYLRRLGAEPDIYIPDRYKEGYGLSLAGIDYARQNKVDLIVVMDCGTGAFDAVGAAVDAGIDIIILDHHRPESALPAAHAVVNPKRPDCSYPFKELSACGVTFKLVQALHQRRGQTIDSIRSLLDFVAVSIACDFVDIRDENRILAHFGLQEINRHARVGLKALIARSGLSYPLTISDIVFGIGPYLNAAGRLADARDAVSLLLAGEWAVATEFANRLRRHNEARRHFDRANLREAIEMWESDPYHDRLPIIVLFKADWHKGVLGIVASRMSKLYHKPAVIMCMSNDQIVGSARSMHGVDIHALLEGTRAYLTSFGGHAAAAGFTLAPDNLEDFAQHLLSEPVWQGADKRMPALEIEAELELEDITPGLIKELKRLAPLGPGNPNPLFACERVQVAGPVRYTARNSVRLTVAKGKSPAFRAAGFRRGDFIGAIDGPEINICYKILESEWNGRKFIQLQLKDVIPVSDALTNPVEGEDDAV